MGSSFNLEEGSLSSSICSFCGVGRIKTNFSLFLLQLLIFFLFFVDSSNLPLSPSIYLAWSFNMSPSVGPFCCHSRGNAGEEEETRCVCLRLLYLFLSGSATGSLEVQNFATHVCCTVVQGVGWVPEIALWEKRQIQTQKLNLGFCGQKQGWRWAVVFPES